MGVGRGKTDGEEEEEEKEKGGEQKWMKQEGCILIYCSKTELGAFFVVQHYTSPHTHHEAVHGEFLYLQRM